MIYAQNETILANMYHKSVCVLLFPFRSEMRGFAFESVISFTVL